MKYRNPSVYMLYAVLLNDLMDVPFCESHLVRGSEKRYQHQWVPDS